MKGNGALPSPREQAEKHRAAKLASRGSRCCRPPLVEWLAEHYALKKAGPGLPNHRIAHDATEAGFPLSESSVAKHLKYHIHE